MPGTKGTAVSLAVKAALQFPDVEKTVFFGVTGKKYPDLPPGVETLLKSDWNRKNFLEELSRVSEGYDLTYFAWADCPLLDPALTASLSERHIKYGAEYSYADGWPYGLAPELLSPGTAGILAKISENDDTTVERDTLFQVIQKDINAFDIETEISSYDLRPYRLTLAADSKRNLLLISRLEEACRETGGKGSFTAAEAIKLLGEDPALVKKGALRTLPAFFNIQVSSACPQECSICPWPAAGAKDGPVTARKEFISRAAFVSLLDKIEDFAGDAVISLSMWGELSLHPEKMELVNEVLERPALSLVIETSGIGWKTDELETLARTASAAALAKPRKNHMAPLSWIVSLDAHDPGRYKEVRGPGFSDAQACAKKLLSLFPGNTYVQAVRVNGFEDDIEHFYRYWKEEGKNLISGGRPDGEHVIIQKYDDFAGALPKLQASDLSPVKRRPCWHIQRDMNIFLDGTVPSCRDDLAALKGEGDKKILGNAFNEDLSVIWERGMALYLEHCNENYKGICANCDEYYTYNF